MSFISNEYFNVEFTTLQYLFSFNPKFSTDINAVKLHLPSRLCIICSTPTINWIFTVSPGEIYPNISKSLLLLLQFTVSTPLFDVTIACFTFKPSVTFPLNLNSFKSSINKVFSIPS